MTGYSSRDIGSPAEINFERLDAIYDELQENSNLLDLYIVVGTITRENSVYYNTAMIFSPFRENKFIIKELYGDGTGIILRLEKMRESFKNG